jgi:MFS family permease
MRNISLFRLFNALILFVPYTPVAIIYFARVSGSYALAATVVATTAITSAVLELPTGVLADHIGKRQVLRLGAGATVLSVIRYAVASSYVLLFLGALLSGLALALFSGNNEALFYESVRKHRGAAAYQRALGDLHSLGQVSLGVAAIFGAMVAAVSYHLLMWVSVMPPLLALGVSLFLKEGQPPSEARSLPHLHLNEAWRLFLVNHKLRSISLYSILTEGIGGAGYSLLPAFYATLVPTWALGIVNFLNKAAVYMSFRFAQPLARWLGERTLLIADNIYERIAGLLGLMFPTPAAPFYMATDGALWGASAVAKADLSQRAFSDRHRATMGSIVSLGTSMMLAVASAGLGMIADLTSPRAALLVAQVALIPTVFVLVRAYRPPPPAPSGSTSAAPRISSRSRPRRSEATGRWS